MHELALVGASEAARFRRIATLAKYVAADRPDTQVAVRHFCGLGRRRRA